MDSWEASGESIIHATTLRSASLDRPIILIYVREFNKAHKFTLPPGRERLYFRGVRQLPRTVAPVSEIKYGAAPRLLSEVLHWSKNEEYLLSKYK